MITRFIGHQDIIRRAPTLLILSALLFHLFLLVGCSSDSTPPVISTVACADLTGTSARISWATDEEATSQVEYGTTAEYESSSTLDTESVTSHSVAIEGLQPQTTYHFRVKSADASGNEAASDDSSFDTPDTVAPVITDARANVIPEGKVKITWATDEESTSQVEFGTTRDFGSLTSPDKKLVTSHEVVLDGLLPETTYYYRVISTDDKSNQVVSESSTFTTPDTVEPVISNVQAAVLADGTVKITWKTDEDATSQVEYGTTTSYGSSSDFDSNKVADHSVSVVGLQVGATYHYRVISSDASGNTKTDDDRTILVSMISQAQRKQIEEIFAAVARLRGLSPKRDVEYEFITTAQLQQKLTPSQQEEQQSRQQIQIAQEVLVLLDMMRPDQDLYQIELDLNTGAVVGFYEFGTHKIYIVSDGGELGPQEKCTIAHEYTHALQDQYFNLTSLESVAAGDSEASAALEALEEGDATLTEYLYAMSELTQVERDTVFGSGSGGGKPEWVPQFLWEDLCFPYLYGATFVSAFDGWEAINSAYSNLPKSTEQILHPEKYASSSSYDAPQTVTIADLDSTLGGSWSQLYSDAFGEFDTRVWLDTFLAEDVATTAAAGWDGDSFEYWKDGSSKQLLVMSSTWDSTTDAQEFFDAYVSYIGAKTSGSWSLIQQDSTTRWWDSANQSVYLERNGQDVLIIIASDDSIISSALPALA